MRRGLIPWLILGLSISSISSIEIDSEAAFEAFIDGGDDSISDPKAEEIRETRQISRSLSNRRQRARSEDEIPSTRPPTFDRRLEHLNRPGRQFRMRRPPPGPLFIRRRLPLHPPAPPPSAPPPSAPPLPSRRPPPRSLSPPPPFHLLSLQAEDLLTDPSLLNLLRRPGVRARLFPSDPSLNQDGGRLVIRVPSQRRPIIVNLPDLQGQKLLTTALIRSQSTTKAPIDEMINRETIVRPPPPPQSPPQLVSRPPPSPSSPPPPSTPPTSIPRAQLSSSTTINPRIPNIRPKINIRNFVTRNGPTITIPVPIEEVTEKSRRPQFPQINQNRLVGTRIFGMISNFFPTTTISQRDIQSTTVPSTTMRTPLVTIPTQPKRFQVFPGFNRNFDRGIQSFFTTIQPPLGLTVPFRIIENSIEDDDNDNEFQEEEDFLATSTTTRKFEVNPFVNRETSTERITVEDIQSTVTLNSPFINPSSTTEIVEVTSSLENSTPESTTTISIPITNPPTTIIPNPTTLEIKKEEPIETTLLTISPEISTISNELEATTETSTVTSESTSSPFTLNSVSSTVIDSDFESSTLTTVTPFSIIPPTESTDLTFSNLDSTTIEGETISPSSSPITTDQSSTTRELNGIDENTQSTRLNINEEDLLDADYEDESNRRLMGRGRSRGNPPNLPLFSSTLSPISSPQNTQSIGINRGILNGGNRIPISNVSQTGSRILQQRPQDNELDVSSRRGFTRPPPPSARRFTATANSLHFTRPPPMAPPRVLETNRASSQSSSPRLLTQQPITSRTMSPVTQFTNPRLISQTTTITHPVPTTRTQSFIQTVQTSLINPSSISTQQATTTINRTSSSPSTQSTTRFSNPSSSISTQSTSQLTLTHTRLPPPTTTLLITRGPIPPAPQPSTGVPSTPSPSPPSSGNELNSNLINEPLPPSPQSTIQRPLFPTIPGSPSAQPPDDVVVNALNVAEDFMAVARRFNLRRTLRRKRMAEWLRKRTLIE